MGKEKPKRKNGCVMWLAALSLLILLFIGGYMVFGRSSGAIPVYAGIEADQATYIVTFDANLLTCPDAESSRCDIGAKVKEGTFIAVSDKNVEYGGFVGDTDLWVRLDVDGKPLFLSMLYVKPISADRAVNALDSNSMMTATAKAN